MIRLFKHYIPVSLVIWAILELGLLLLSFEAGVRVRYWLADITPQPFAERYVASLIFSAAVFVNMIALGLYTTAVTVDMKATVVRLFVSLLMSAIVIALVIFISGSDIVWRSVFVLAVVFAAFVITFSRLVFSQYIDVSRFKTRVLVYGAGEQAMRLREFALAQPGTRFMILAFIHPDHGPPKIDGAIHFETIKSLLKYALNRRVDELVIALDERRGQLPIHDLLSCKMNGVRILDLSTFLEREKGYVDLTSVQPSGLIFSDSPIGGTDYDRLLKRLFDIVLSVTFVILTLPILILTALLIKLTSRGPVFYRQERAGRLGRPFLLYKFRSMRADAEKDGTPQWAQQNDPRVTPVGRFIRRTRIDEIPQIINVLKGDMSFVGPRPERPFFVDSLSEDIPYYRERHIVRPGITGWAQLNFPYGASKEDARRKLEYDLYYIKNYSLFLDFIILLQTVRVILLQEGAR